MFSPQTYFEVDDVAFVDVLSSVTSVWEGIPRIGRWVREKIASVPEAHRLSGDISPRAYVEGDVVIAPGAVVEPGAYVQGPAFIGENALIRHGAYLRGGCYVGRGCTVGHATEVKNALLMDGASASHFNYVGDSIVGRRANLGAGVKISNFKNDGTEIVVVDGSTRRKTGLIKFGAIVGDDVMIGCNAVLSPGTLIGRGTHVYSGTVVRGVIKGEHIVKLRQTTEIVARDAR